jgi:hypothetical protein
MSGLSSGSSHDDDAERPISSREPTFGLERTSKRVDAAVEARSPQRSCSLSHLLIEEHPEEQRERIGVQELISVGIAGDEQGPLHRPDSTDQGPLA